MAYAKTLLIDQMWVRSWGQGLSQRVIETNLEWFSRQTQELRELILRFPLCCVVRGEDHHEIPYPTTVGMVHSYRSDGVLGVKQSPDDPDEQIQYHPASELTFVKPWGPFTAEFLRGYLIGESQRDEYTKPEARRSFQLHRGRLW